MRSGERVLGTVVASPDPALAELLAEHFDFLWIDLEHSALTVRDVQALAIAARAARCAALVRPPTADATVLGALLDAGVDGVVAPRVEDSAVAARLASALRYPPDGSRGFAHRRASGYGQRRAAGEPPLCLLQIESRIAVERVDALASVPGIDGLVVGPNDLALDLGVAPDLGSAELQPALRAVEAAARSAGIVSGVAAGGRPEAVVESLGATSTLLAYSADVRLYADAAASAARAVSAAWGTPAVAASAAAPASLTTTDEGS